MAELPYLTVWGRIRQWQFILVDKLEKMYKVVQYNLTDSVISFDDILYIFITNLILSCLPTLFS